MKNPPNQSQKGGLTYGAKFSSSFFNGAIGGFSGVCSPSIQGKIIQTFARVCGLLPIFDHHPSHHS